MRNGAIGYAELHAISNFTFLRGGSHPRELVETAVGLGYRALALTDECTLAGMVRAHQAAAEHRLPLIVGSEMHLEEGTRLVLLVTGHTSYRALCRLITLGRRASGKGSYRLTREDVAGHAAGCIALLLERAAQRGLDAGDAAWAREVFGEDCRLAYEPVLDGFDRHRAGIVRSLSREYDIPVLASGNVHIHCRDRQPLQDVLTAIRLGVPLSRAGLALHSNGEWFMHPLQELAQRVPAAWLAESVSVAERCRFDLSEIRYRYPHEDVPERSSPYLHLRRLTVKGMRRRWPHGAPAKVREQVLKELRLVRELGYEAYFLTVYEIVQFARSRNILCQGRGSAANSAVCFCLGITEVDPARMDLLFERFVSRERNEPPDIDVDFEHQRREEVIQHIYRKYGRDRAALTATVISYHPRSAVRDIGRALDLDQAAIDALCGNLSWWDGDSILPERVREAGLDPDHPTLSRLLPLAAAINGFPRHLSQHTGGFVISHDPLHELVPIENAAMAERTVIQWDKDDIDALGILKVDCLALGMLTAIHRCLELVSDYSGRTVDMAAVPAEDPAVYEMISHADTVGVFQIESRAQMAMLPRLRPRNFYDLVIEVAIVRPGPIQGDMVHPYLKRRQGLEPVNYPSEAVRRVLERTLGVPIFQEQVIKLAMVAAGFTPGEADALRRSMAAWKRHGGLGHFRHKLVAGMRDRGYAADFAERIYRQILGFGEYGFPESHAASFALLVYVSAWLKRHHPAAFCCALLNSQPMGFYAPAQLVIDARNHGVEVREPTVNRSLVESTLERIDGGVALRLGLGLVRHLSAAGAARVAASRPACGYGSVQELSDLARLDGGDLDALAAAGALDPLSGHRRQAAWEAGGVAPPLPALRGAWIDEPAPLMPPPAIGEQVYQDYAALGLSLRSHPLALLRHELERRGIRPADRVRDSRHGARVRVAGIVTCRQHPSSANNVVFVTLEDETGYVNLVVWQQVAERERPALLGARLMAAWGEVQRDGEVVHVVARQLRDYSDLLAGLTLHSRDFR